MRSAVLVPLGILLALGIAGADGCVPTTTVPDVTLPFALLYGSGFTYIDNDPCQLGCIFSVWYYEEYNDFPGLQRGDEVVDDTCGGLILSDAWQF